MGFRSILPHRAEAIGSRALDLQSRAMPEPVAVIAESLRGARIAARRIAESSRLRAPLTACTPASYLRRGESAPSRVVLCASAGSAERAASFLRACAARLLWPAPPGDLHRAIDGIRAGAHAPHGPKRAPAATARRHVTSARLLEGRVDGRRAALALATGPPLEWIVESPRHVRLTAAQLAALAVRGVRWSALEPVELVAVYGPASVERSRRAWGNGLPKNVPYWSR
jgi:hypothetical protein